MSITSKVYVQCTSALAALLLEMNVSAYGAERITHARLEDEGRVVIFTVAAAQARYAAPVGKFWDHLVVAGDGQSAYLVLQRGARNEGWSHEDVHQFSVRDYLTSPKTYSLQPIPLVCDLKEASVEEVFAASNDGSRLLIAVHYCYANETDGSAYR